MYLLTVNGTSVKPHAVRRVVKSNGQNVYLHNNMIIWNGGAATSAQTRAQALRTNVERSWRECIFCTTRVTIVHNDKYYVDNVRH